MKSFQQPRELALKGTNNSNNNNNKKEGGELESRKQANIVYVPIGIQQQWVESYPQCLTAKIIFL
ncbi:MAG: hypothetical protein M5E90_00220 [Asgard group archaeon]|nr:hypothetical protein [Asgard group archaeon]